MTPLVSILIPAFNAADWIGDTIRSALAQTWPRKEIIIVDDGSRDDTVAIARRFASKDLAIVSQPNQGAAAARNHAFSICQGDYVQWLDADDLLGRDKIARQMQARPSDHDPRLLLSSAWAEFMYRPHRAKFVPTALWCDLSPTEWLLRKLALDVYMQTATWLVSRELTQAAGPWNTAMLGDDDGEYFCRVLLASRGVRFVEAARVFYRISGANRLSYIGRSERKMEAHWASVKLHIRYLLGLEDSERVRAAALHFLQMSVAVVYPERLDIVDEAQQLAASLGGRLEVPPPLSWKYAWIEKTCGASVAKHAQLSLRGWKRSVARSIDKVLATLDPHDRSERCPA